jgi:hypothetical protein
MQKLDDEREHNQKRPAWRYCPRSAASSSQPIR